MNRSEAPINQMQAFFIYRRLSLTKLFYFRRFANRSDAPINQMQAFILIGAWRQHFFYNEDFFLFSALC